MTRLRPSQAPLLLLLALSLPAPALQIVDAMDGETAFARISQKEPTRIAFERGRIRKVTGNTGEFVLEKDEDKGQVFIRPALPGSTKPINVFVSSDRSTVALLLQPVDSPSDTIVIREGRTAGNSPSRIERGGRHVRTIKNLLLAMATDALPEDMEIRATDRELALWPGVRLTLQRVYLGAGIVGEKYQLANTANADLTLTESDLYKSGVMAVSLEHRSLRSGEATNLFVIRERRAND
jgi:conjugal transfer pilus assembly protein TraK